MAQADTTFFADEWPRVPDPVPLSSKSRDRDVGVCLLKDLRVVWLQRVLLQRASTKDLTVFMPMIHEKFTPTLTTLLATRAQPE